GDEAEAEIAGYSAKGFTAAKMRVVGRDGFSIANCVRRVKAARRGIGPNVELMIDAHGSLEVATAIKLARELEPYDIAWFEEPVSPDDHAGQAEVRRSTTIPIASGEREFTRFDFQDLLERRALDIAQPDVARAGGMTEIRRIAALTSAPGMAGHGLPARLPACQAADAGGPQPCAADFDETRTRSVSGGAHGRSRSPRYQPRFVGQCHVRPGLPTRSLHLGAPACARLLA